MVLTLIRTCGTMMREIFDHNDCEHSGLNGQGPGIHCAK